MNKKRDWLRLPVLFLNSCHPNNCSTVYVHLGSCVILSLIQKRMSASRHKCSKNLVTKWESRSELMRLIVYSACSSVSPYGVSRPRGTTMRGFVWESSGVATASNRAFAFLISGVSPTATSKSREGWMRSAGF